MDADNKLTESDVDWEKVNALIDFHKPGSMFYYETLRPILKMPFEDIGRIVVAMLKYGEFYILPQLDGALDLAWSFIQPVLDRDDKKYKLDVMKRMYATFCRERKKKGDPEIGIREWLNALLTSLDEPNHHKISSDAMWYPTTITNPITKTIPISTTAAVAITNTNAKPPEVAAAAAGVKEGVKPFGGTLGKDVVFLTDEQVEDLLERMGLETFNHYVEQLSDFILRQDARPKSHYETILKWWREDSSSPARPGR